MDATMLRVSAAEIVRIDCKGLVSKLNGIGGEGDEAGNYSRLNGIRPARFSGSISWTGAIVCICSAFSLLFENLP